MCGMTGRDPVVVSIRETSKFGPTQFRRIGSGHASAAAFEIDGEWGNPSGGCLGTVLRHGPLRHWSFYEEF